MQFSARTSGPAAWKEALTVKKSIRFAPPNLSFFFEDSAGGNPPDIDDIAAGVWASRSSLIVGCLAFMDGETDLTVSTSSEDVLEDAPRFDGVIDTPSRVLQVITSHLEVLMRFDVPSHFTRVRVWTNRLREPDRILVVLG